MMSFLKKIFGSTESKPCCGSQQTCASAPAQKAAPAAPAAQQPKAAGCCGSVRISGTCFQEPKIKPTVTYRSFGSDMYGRAFDGAVKMMVWEKAEVIPGRDPKTWRKDAYGNTIFFDDFNKGKQDAWEIDHIKPVAKGGTDAPVNLQPVHWLVNRKKGDNWPVRPGDF